LDKSIIQEMGVEVVHFSISRVLFLVHF